MPHFHQCADHTFCLTVGLWPVTTGELLPDAMFHTGFDKTMLSSSFIFLTIVRVSIFNGIGTFINDLFKKELGTVLCLVREDPSVQFPGIIINGNE